jgi:hypothetical protein
MTTTGTPIFASTYRSAMQPELVTNPLRDPAMKTAISAVRTQAIAQINAGEWFDDPLVSIINGQIKTSHDVQPTVAALTGKQTGLKQQLSAENFAQWLSATQNLQQQKLIPDIDKIARLNMAIDDFCQQQRTPEAIGQILAEVFVDFNAEKMAEIDERFDTQQRHTALSAISIADLCNGKLQYGISKAGVVVAPVVNFGTLLDVQQKTLHALRHGIKVTWLVRQGEAAQQVTREILRLHQRLIMQGLADMLDIVVLSLAQRDQFFQQVGLPTQGHLTKKPDR